MEVGDGGFDACGVGGGDYYCAAVFKGGFGGAIANAWRGVLDLE